MEVMAMKPSPSGRMLQPDLLVLLDTCSRFTGFVLQEGGTSALSACTGSACAAQPRSGTLRDGGSMCLTYWVPLAPIYEAP